jgi:crossover junction endodeoxyribonuclease RuvC
MRIVGIDPGLKAMGYGFIDSTGVNNIKLLETGTVEPKQKDLLQNKLLKIHTLLDELLKEYKPDVLVVEKLYAHSKYKTTASILGHARGVICLVCAQNNITLVEHSVKRIRKAVCGNGNATKQQVRKIVGHILNVDEKKLTLDASDALALAIGFTYMNQTKL